jgi:hypothetical protein
MSDTFGKPSLMARSTRDVCLAWLNVSGGAETRQPG